MQSSCLTVNYCQLCKLLPTFVNHTITKSFMSFQVSDRDVGYILNKIENATHELFARFGKRKKVIENLDKSKITKYLIIPICFC